MAHHITNGPRSTKRLTKFKGVCVRNPITLADVRFRPDERLAKEMARLEQLAAATEQRWRILVGDQLGGNVVNSVPL
jgi:hypothetical protein